jgi:hypothetical protein
MSSYILARNYLRPPNFDQFFGDCEFYRPRPWDEIYGKLHHLEESKDCTLALIGKTPVIFPQEMFARLEDLQGQEIGVLRTDSDYRVRPIKR